MLGMGAAGPPTVYCRVCSKHVAMKDWKQHAAGGKHKQAAVDNGMSAAAVQAHDAKITAKIPAVIPKVMAMPVATTKKADAKVYPVPSVHCKACCKDVAMKDWRAHMIGNKHIVSAASNGMAKDELATHDAAVTASIPSPIPSAKDWYLQKEEEEEEEEEEVEQTPEEMKEVKEEPDAWTAGPSSSSRSPSESPVPQVVVVDAVAEPTRCYFTPAKRRNRKQKPSSHEPLAVGFTYIKEKPKRSSPQLNNRPAAPSPTALCPFPMHLTVPASPTLEGLGLLLDATLTVEEVTPKSPAAFAGMLPAMQVTGINGAPAGTLEAFTKALASNKAATLEVTVQVDSSQRQTGKVREHLADKGIAFITPDRPLFVQEGLLGDTSCVYIGDLFYRCDDDNELCEDVAVEFEVRCLGGRLTACCLEVCAGAAGTKKAKALRAGADVSALVDFMKKRHDLRQVKTICMLFAGGKCPDAPKGSLCCKRGLHISYESKPADMCDYVHIIQPSEAKTYMTIPVKANSYVNAVNKINGVASFRAEKGSRQMTLTYNGEKHAPFGTIQFKGEGGDMQVVLPEINKSVDIPVAKAALLLGRLKCMADNAGLKHDIPTSWEKERFKQDLMVQVNESKLELLRQKWNERRCASGYFWFDDNSRKSQVINAWQLTNEALEFRFRATEYNMTHQYGKAPDMIEGFHGTHEDNVLSIARHGFDPLRRAGQVYGEGEYFAKNPCVSMGYCRWGGFMFLCKLILGKQDTDHTWVEGCQYYIMKQREGNIQALPMYLIQWGTPTTSLPKKLARYSRDEMSSTAFLRRMGEKQRGGSEACRGRVNGGMAAATTRHLWLGWLDPSLVADEAALCKDVKLFLEGHEVVQVVPDRNGARIGAYALLKEPATQAQVAALNTKPYGKQGRISVDDAQPGNPFMADKPCPMLKGPGRYCRGANLRGHDDWTKVCSFRHDERDEVTADAVLRYEEVPEDSAKYNELAGEVVGMGYKVTRVRRVVNRKLEAAYESRRYFLNEKHGSIIERELWHGTACKVLDEILRKGLQCPADSNPSEACNVSGGKGLATTLCGVKCTKCTEAHKWGRCHMFGKGIYFADEASKSHRYVRPDGETHSLVRCRVNLGSPYLIKANLLTQDALHSLVSCENPSRHLDYVAQKWDYTQGHESYYVKGLGSNHKFGYGVMNSEYIVFHPYQVMPLYVVEYTVSP
eukprot:TRINITY_DN926_c0_g2_i1.p1 TRINITY_DN926_c0_g2~~TRINITY_DN926_c0_g2_i1.p1  ORF type:complete len:1200 (+),score=408.55 TRINITY_DN926_c0_g2_i1:80-3679(+)